MYEEKVGGVEVFDQGLATALDACRRSSLLLVFAGRPCEECGGTHLRSESVSLVPSTDNKEDAITVATFYRESLRSIEQAFDAFVREIKAEHPEWLGEDDE